MYNSGGAECDGALHTPSTVIRSHHNSEQVRCTSEAHVKSATESSKVPDPNTIRDSPFHAAIPCSPSIHQATKQLFSAGLLVCPHLQMAFFQIAECPLCVCDTRKSRKQVKVQHMHQGRPDPMSH